jgi:uncharacterized membrane protein
MKQTLAMISIIAALIFGSIGALICGSIGALLAADFQASVAAFQSYLTEQAKDQCDV